MPQDPTKNDILDKLKRWFTGGAISVQGVYISRDQCASALYMLDRYIVEDSADSWKETCEEIKRISSWQIKLLVDNLSDMARAYHAYLHANRNTLFKDCGDEVCASARNALKEVGA